MRIGRDIERVETVVARIERRSYLDSSRTVLELENAPIWILNNLKSDTSLEGNMADTSSNTAATAKGVERLDRDGPKILR